MFGAGEWVFGAGERVFGAGVCAPVAWPSLFGAGVCVPVAWPSLFGAGVCVNLNIFEFPAEQPVPRSKGGYLRPDTTTYPFDLPHYTD